jgi:cyanophycin synthetase
LEAARNAAARLKPPLVVKPLDRNGSSGVTVGIDTRAELDEAVAEALRLSPAGKALVEKFVPGDEHRLSVFGGKFFRASRLDPAQIVCDGERSIAEIISDENAVRREILSNGDTFVHELNLDARMAALIRKQGFTPKDCPPAGQYIRLAGTSNLKSGGRRVEVTSDVHPENVAMAEAIARGSRMDAAGIDFITPDISKPWTEVPCAIIEVNSNLGTDDAMAAQTLRRRFGEGSDGTIPSLFVLGDGFELAHPIALKLSEDGICVGLTSNATTMLGGQMRFLGDAGLPQRIYGMLIDPACEVLVVQMTADVLRTFGLPHTRYDLAVVAPGCALDEGMRQVIAENAKAIIEAGAGDDARPIAQRLLATR